MNPLDMPTDSLEYLKVESSAPRSSIDPFGTYYQHVLMVDAYTLEEKRIRYNFWLALSDVGGFRDGLYIILSAIIGPIVAILYENDLLKDHLRSQTLSATQKRQSENLKRVLAQPTDTTEADKAPYKMQTVIDAVHSMKTIKLNLGLSICDCICRGIKRNRR